MTKLPLGRVGSRSLNKARALDLSPVAGLPSAVGATGTMRFVSNGDAGQPCIAVSNGAAWLRIALGPAVSVSGS